MKIYGDIQSGNCYKLKIACEALKIDHDWIHIDILKGETKSTAFLAMAPNAKIPILALEDGRMLSESNAILNFLCENNPLYPNDPWQRAKIHQWQFFEQYSHEPYIAVARFIRKYLGLPEDRRDEYEAKQQGGKKALSVMEKQLSATAFIAGDTRSTADISLYAYTHVADEGGFDLQPYPAVRAWITTLESDHGFTPMPRS